MSDIHHLARPEVFSMTPYTPGMAPERVGREYGIAKIVKLASNESSLGASEAVIAAIANAARETHLYPEGDSHDLRCEIASRLGISSKNLLVGNGVDNVLTCLGLAFIRPGDRCVLAVPTYPGHGNIVQLMGGQPVSVPLHPDWSCDLERMVEQAAHCKILFLCNPNNPTGIAIPPDALRQMICRIKSDVMIIIDEAYHEYMDPALVAPELPDWAVKLPTLLILRTFSKIYGLAGLRIGYVIGHVDVISVIDRVREPFPVSRLAQAAALVALKECFRMKRAKIAVQHGRKYLTNALRGMGCTVLPSQANFVFADLRQPVAEVETQLMRRGIVIRNGALWNFPTWARISVGSTQENESLVEALKEILTSI